MALAAQLGLKDYAQPAGGCCFLTDHHYCMRLQDLWASRGERQYELDDIMLLKVGRHIRPAANFKVIIAREEGEGNFLRGYRKQYPSLDIISHRGPFALLDGDPAPEDVKLAASIIGRYSQGRNADEITLQYRTREGEVSEIRVLPMNADDVPDNWLIRESEIEWWQSQDRCFRFERESDLFQQRGDVFMSRANSRDRN
jgi:hypothetical protein